MSDKALVQLRRIAGLRLDLRLARLQAAAQATAGTRGALDAVDTAAEAARGADWADPRAAERFETWAMAQRRSLNQTLAQHLVAQDQARAEAAQAFGQQDALRRIEALRREALRLARSRHL